MIVKPVMIFDFSLSLHSLLIDNNTSTWYTVLFKSSTNNEIQMTT